MPIEKKGRLLLGGLLLGFGGGLCFGCSLFFLTFASLHMFILGVAWRSPMLWFMVGVPLVLLFGGGVLLWRATGYAIWITLSCLFALAWLYLPFAAYLGSMGMDFQLHLSFVVVSALTLVGLTLIVRSTWRRRKGT